MSLMKLLSVGQSLEKHSTAPSPYKLKAENRLPKFAAMPRPISLAPVAKPAEVPPDLFASARAETALAVEESPVVTAPVSAPDPVAPVPVFELPVATPAAPAPAALAPTPVAAPAAKPARKPRKGFLFFRTVAEAEQRLVQSELALQSVKVVRNDLNETDFEIVTPKPASTASIVPAVPPVALPPPVAVALKQSSPLWQRVTDRVVGYLRTLL